jgi:hypothetical protein
MSKIALTPDASGTGTFTIAAPNGNTDRTLTLPDATGTVNVSGLANEVPAGSAGAPAIYPTGDSNTGIFFPAADTWAVTTASTERARIDSSGNLLVGTTSNPGGGFGGERFVVNTAVNTSLFRTTAAPNEGTALSCARTSNGIQISFHQSGSAIGSISTNGTSTSYGTTSDYRLKENVAPMQNALDTVAQLNPVTYTWKADGSAGQGFIAHELQAVVPDCVTGEKDAVDKDGNPQYQGVDTSFLVATLTAAIKEQQAQIEDLKAEVATLKGASA